MNRIRVMVVVTVALVAAFGCREDSPEDVGAGDPDRPLYEARCAVCHALDGSSRGPSAGSGDLGDPDWHSGRSEAAIREVILQGKGKMPSFRGKLTSDELDRIVQYVQRLPELKSGE